MTPSTSNDATATATTRAARRLAALLAAPILAIVCLACGFPTGDSTFDEIDGDVLGGLNDPTTTTTTVAPTTTTMPDVADSAPTTTVPVTEPPPMATAAVFFISRGSLSPVSIEIDPLAGLNELVALLEAGPPSDAVGQRLDSYVEPGLIVGTPVPEGGVLQVVLDRDTFDAINQRNQRQAYAQIVVTLLKNTPAVGQVSFTVDDEVQLIPADGGSKEAASVDDFQTLLGTPRSANDQALSTSTSVASSTTLF